MIPLTVGVGNTTLMNKGISAGKYLTTAEFAVTAAPGNTDKTEYFCSLTLGSEQFIAGGRITLAPGYKGVLPVTYAFNSSADGRIVAACTVLAAGNTGSAYVEVRAMPVGSITPLMP